jgi:site-specific DNA recombinase
MTETVALYARVSTDEQADKQTIRTQLEYARGRAKLEGWTVREFIDDGVSGKKIPFAKRPAGAELVAAIRRGDIARVITYRLDRLARRARFIHEALEEFTAAGVAYQSLTEPFDTSTPAGKLFLGVLAVMAEFESDSIQQRTSEGKHRVSVDDDRWLAGVVPYGYSLTEDSRLVIEPAEADVVRQIFAWVLDHKPYGWIERELNERGIPASRAGRGKRKNVSRMTWYREKISDIVRGEIYAGRAAFFRTSRSREATYRNVPAIVTPATYLAAREATASNKKFGGSHSTFAYRLRGLVACGRCGYTLIGRPWGKAHGYYCHRCPKGERGFVDEARLLEVLWRDVLEFVGNPDATLRAIARSSSEVGTAEEQAERELMALAQKLHEIDDQETQLLELRLAKTITAPILDRKAKALGTDREHVRLRMDAVRAQRAAAARAVEESAAARRLLAQLRKLTERAGEDLAMRAEIIRTATKGITFHAKTGKVQIRYAFGAPALVPAARGDLVAASPTGVSSPHRDSELSREHVLV